VDDAIHVREPDRDDLRTLGGILARAFRDNPLNVAVIGATPAVRERCNRHGMRALLPVAQGHGLVRVARRGAKTVGVLVAVPPFAHPLPPPSLGARVRLVWGQGPRVARGWHRVFRQLDSHHPRDPHWYLGTLGVHPVEQGRGAGTALLGDFVRLADADGLPSYLETDHERNLPFYERAGFRVETEIRICETRIWRMLREPRRA